jgi:hypothetical protein
VVEKPSFGPSLLPPAIVLNRIKLLMKGEEEIFLVRILVLSTPQWISHFRFCFWKNNRRHHHRPAPPGGLQIPDGLVVRSCTSHPGVLGSIPKRERPWETGAPCVKVPGFSVPRHSSRPSARHSHAPLLLSLLLSHNIPLPRVR